MAIRMDRIVGQSPAAHYNGGSNYLIQANSGAYYLVFVNGLSDVVYVKSTDGGATWAEEVTVFAGTVNNLSVWYDRWSGLSSDYIHCAYVETGGNDCLYRAFDTASSDTLGTQTTIFDGASAAAGGSAISISRARGGNVYCKVCIDAGVEGGFFRLPNANVPSGAWDAARTDSEALATLDQWHLLPSWNADNQDMMMFFWDASASEISRCLYDDSGNSWSETSIATSMTANAAATDYPYFAAAVDLANSRNLVAAWSAKDTLNADLRCWMVTEGAITETTTNVVLNSTDDQMLCALGIDTTNSIWYVFYCGKSDGSETVKTSLNIYYKTSSDSGATWGSETQLSDVLRGNRNWMATIPRFTGSHALAHVQALNSFLIAVNMAIPSGGSRIIGG